MVKEYLKITKQFRNYNDATQDPQYTQVILYRKMRISRWKIPNDFFFFFQIDRDVGFEHDCNIGVGTKATT